MSSDSGKGHKGQMTFPKLPILGLCINQDISRSYWSILIIFGSEGVKILVASLNVIKNIINQMWWSQRSNNPQNGRF